MNAEDQKIVEMLKANLGELNFQLIATNAQLQIAKARIAELEKPKEE